jgi:hypothetical protein
MLLALWACTDGGSLQPGNGSSQGAAGDADPDADADIDADADTDVDEDVDTVPGDPPLSLWINEIQAASEHGAVDERGEVGDWIELYNGDTADRSLAGFTITDKVDEPARHALDASLVVPAGGFLVLWADRDAEVGPTHLGFALDADGDDVALFDPSGALVSRVEFGPQLRDASLARTADGGADFDVVLAPTPGASNGPPDGTLGKVDAEPLGTCAPVAAVTSAHLLEGESAEVTLSCADLSPLDAVHVDVRTVSPDPVWSLPKATWSTGPDDAGRVDLLFAVRPPGSIGVPHTAVAKVWVADDFANPANVPVDPMLYEEEWGLPVLHLDPEGAVDQDYTPMHAWYRGVAYTGQMKIRGAASAGYPKPSYTLNFDPEQLDLGDDGLQKKDHLVVMSNFDDSAYVRQKLVFDTWAAMAEHEGTQRLVPRTFFVVIFLDGRYGGLYTGVDHPDDEFMGEMGFNRDANLYKAVDHNANFYVTNTYGNPKTTLHQGYEKKEGLPEDDFSDLDDLVDFTGRSTHAAFDAEADTWLDRSEFQDWFALVHWTSSADSAGKNAYLYNDPAALGWHYVPWDFNHSYGQNWYTARVPSNVYEDFTWNNAVFWHFQADTAMAAELWSRFAALREPGEPLALDAQQALMEGYYAEIEDSCQRDWDRWGNAYWDYWDWARSDDNDFEDERAYLEQWIVERDGWMSYYHP